jgi:hypothetical protein
MAFTSIAFGNFHHVYLSHCFYSSVVVKASRIPSRQVYAAMQKEFGLSCQGVGLFMDLFRLGVELNIRIPFTT